MPATEKGKRNILKVMFAVVTNTEFVNVFIWCSPYLGLGALLSEKQRKTISWCWLFCTANCIVGNMLKSPVCLGGDLMKNSALNFHVHFPKTLYQMTNNASVESIRYRLDEIRGSEIKFWRISNPWTRPEGSSKLRLEASRFQDSRRMKVVRLSALGIGRLYHPGIAWNLLWNWVLKLCCENANRK